MTSAIDEAKRLRVREADRSDDAHRPGSGAVGGAPCLVVRTKVVSTYPTSPARYFACEPQTILGAEVEGGAAVVTADSSTLFALNLGTVVPPPGTAILVTFVGNRWVFRHDG